MFEEVNKTFITRTPPVAARTACSRAKTKRHAPPPCGPGRRAVLCPPHHSLSSLQRITATRSRRSANVPAAPRRRRTTHVVRSVATTPARAVVVSSTSPRTLVRQDAGPDRRRPSFRYLCACLCARAPALGVSRVFAPSRVRPPVDAAESCPRYLFPCACAVLLCLFAGSRARPTMPSSAPARPNPE